MAAGSENQPFLKAPSLPEIQEIVTLYHILNYLGTAS